MINLNLTLKRFIFTSRNGIDPTFFGVNPNLILTPTLNTASQIDFSYCIKTRPQLSNERERKASCLVITRTNNEYKEQKAKLND